MQLGMIGLGRMGQNMVVRLAKAGHQLVVNDRSADVIAQTQARISKEAGGQAGGASALADFVGKLTAPRAIWLMIAGRRRRPRHRRSRAAARQRRHPDRRRQLLLHRRHPPRQGAGGQGHPVRRRRHQRRRLGSRARLLPDDRRRQGGGEAPRSDLQDAGARPGDDRRGRPGASRSAAPPRKAICTAVRRGAGHFVKMVHNGIEYGIMAAYAEGLNIIKNANVGKKGARARRRGDAAAQPRALPVRLQPRGRSPSCGGAAAWWPRGYWISRPPRSAKTPIWRGSRAGCRTPARAAGRCWPPSTKACPPRADASLYQRFTSRGEDEFACKTVQAMRRKFGGH